MWVLKQNEAVTHHLFSFRLDNNNKNWGLIKHQVVFLAQLFLQVAAMVHNHTQLQKLRRGCCWQHSHFCENEILILQNVERGGWMTTLPVAHHRVLLPQLFLQSNCGVPRCDLKPIVAMSQCGFCVCFMSVKQQSLNQDCSFIWDSVWMWWLVEETVCQILTGTIIVACCNVPCGQGEAKFLDFRSDFAKASTAVMKQSALMTQQWFMQGCVGHQSMLGWNPQWCCFTWCNCSMCLVGQLNQTHLKSTAKFDILHCFSIGLVLSKNFCNQNWSFMHEWKEKNPNICSQECIVANLMQCHSLWTIQGHFVFGKQFRDILFLLLSHFIFWCHSQMAHFASDQISAKFFSSQVKTHHN